ncbi:hypothetical protein FRC19_002519 [Serendipita sp. 401]|nr:hypothetical protein FRC15_004837 [Serendipita sp. 397]KAG8800534.1 hypothetical protein FRC16_002650 [Serendipita sp. 398]KAG8824109.1 hypothetical protein FRC19_002519 [Serendipita sp. 401]KAG8868659.1 hypothetical protein FRC20_003024 [Serendipita sp. 405]KAG9055006.1 hypothetical protein FS842_003421 [Serendipita sp. 407]
MDRVKSLVISVQTSCETVLQVSQPLFHAFPSTVLVFRSQVLALHRDVELINHLDDTYHAILRDLWQKSDIKKLVSLLEDIQTFMDAIVRKPSKSSITNPSRPIYRQLALKTVEEMEEATERVQSLRRKVTDTLKTAVRDRLPTLPAQAEGDNTITSEFSKRPLGLMASHLQHLNVSAEFLSIVLSEQTSHKVRTLSLDWGQRLGKTRASVRLFLLVIWSQLVPTLVQPWSTWPSASGKGNHAAIKQLEASIEQLDQYLRDLVIRQKMERFRIAFIGVESSGKSTLINYLIKAPLLDVDPGQATAYPCRIQHVPGQKVPRLTVDADYLVKRAKEVGALVPLDQMIKLGREWDGEGLPDDLKNQEISKFYLLVIYRRSRDNLEMFQDSKFSVEPITYGEDIAKTLRIINDIVLSCLALRIPFETFGQSRWAVIEMDLPVYKNISENYEFLDLPGLYGSQGKIHWEELVRETLREADVIIVVIAAPDVISSAAEAQAWRSLPFIVRAGSNLEPNAAILTKIDSLGRKERDPERRREEVAEAFWPYSDHDKKDFILEGSPLIGDSARLYLSTFKDTSARPNFSEIWETRMGYTLQQTFGTVENVSEKSIQDVYTVVQGSEKRSQMQDVEQHLGQILSGINANQVRQEMQRLSSRLDSIQAIFLECIPTAVVPDPEVAPTETIAMKAAALRAEWDARKRQFSTDCAELSSRITEILKQGAVSSLTSAILMAANERSSTTVDHTLENTSLMSFRSSGEISSFVRLVESHLLSHLRELEREAESSAKKGLSVYRSAQLKNLAQKVGNLDAESEAQLIPLAVFTGSNVDFGMDLKFPDGIDEEHITFEIVSVPPKRLNYHDVQIRFLRRLTHGKDVDPADVSPLSRALLKVFAFIPFLFASLVKSQSTTEKRYRLDLDGFRSALSAVVTASWSDPLSKAVQTTLMKETERGEDIIADAISIALFQSTATGRPTAVERNPELDPATLRAVAAAFVNLTGALAVLGSDGFGEPAE